MDTCEDCNSVIDNGSFNAGCFGYTLCQECLDIRGESRLHSARVQADIINLNEGEQCLTY